jgi:mannose-1-phosphate guanylyltransferase/phosphomannomutase
MKTVILAAGKGTRLRPLTYNIPKCMVPINGKPLLEYTINLLKKHGLTDIIITTGYLAYQIQYYFNEGRDYGVNILYTKEKELLGTAGGLKRIQNFLDDTFVLIYGYNFTNMDLASLIKFHKKNKADITLALYEEKDKPSTKGLVEIDKRGRITKFVEKPEKPFTKLANAAIYVIEPEIMKFIPDNMFFDLNRDLIPFLIKKGKSVYGLKIDYLVDIGTHKTYKKADKDAKKGRVKF